MNYREGLRNIHCSKCTSEIGFFMVRTPLEAKMLIQFNEERKWYCTKCFILN